MNQSTEISSVPGASAQVDQESPLSGLMELLTGWNDEISPDAFDDQNIANLDIDTPPSPIPKPDLSGLLDSLVDDRPMPIATTAKPVPDQPKPAGSEDEESQAAQISGLLGILSGWALPENSTGGDATGGEGLGKDGVSTLQDLLVGPFATQLRRDLDRVDGTVTGMEQKLTDLEQQVANTSALAESLMPMIADLIDRKFAQLKAEIVASVVEAVDEQEQSISIQVSGVSDRS
jgi:hypothetical protein